METLVLIVALAILLVWCNTVGMRR